MYPLQHHHPVTFAKLLNIGHFIGNILLFLPVGMGLYLLFRRIFPDSIRKILLAALGIGFILSTGIELFQYFVPQRIPSVADVIENTGGAVFGCYLLYFRKMYREIKTRKNQIFSRDLIFHARRIILQALIGKLMKTSCPL